MAWTVDLAHTQVAFRIRHLGISFIQGNFQVADADLSLEEGDSRSSHLSVRLDVSTLDTRDPNRDGHLKSADFFDAEQFPYIQFTSTEVVDLGNGRFRVTGDLTVRDVTRPLELEGEYSGPVDDPVSGKRKIGFLLTGTIAQKDWGIGWNVPMGSGFMLADRVNLTIDAQAIEV